MVRVVVLDQPPGLAGAVGQFVRPRLAREVVGEEGPRRPLQIGEVGQVQIGEHGRVPAAVCEPDARARGSGRDGRTHGAALAGASGSRRFQSVGRKVVAGPSRWSRGGRGGRRDRRGGVVPAPRCNPRALMQPPCPDRHPVCVTRFRPPAPHPPAFSQPPRSHRRPAPMASRSFTAPDPASLTLGCEEEFQIVDPKTAKLASGAEKLKAGSHLSGDRAPQNETAPLADRDRHDDLRQPRGGPRTARPRPPRPAGRRRGGRRDDRGRRHPRLRRLARPARHAEGAVPRHGLGLPVPHAGTADLRLPRARRHRGPGPRRAGHEPRPAVPVHAAGPDGQQPVLAGRGYGVRQLPHAGLAEVADDRPAAVLPRTGPTTTARSAGW